MSHPENAGQQGEHTGLVADCKLMLRYARKNGLLLSDQLTRDIAELDALLKQAHMSPISDISPALIAAAGPSDFNEDGTPLPPTAHPQVEILILSVHAELSEVIAPATALTLQVSEPPPGPHRLFGGLPPIVKAAAFCAFGSALAFMAGAAIQSQAPDSSVLNSLMVAVNVLFGASLGAAFYVLVRTQPYLTNRSYDPKYNAAYISRFITGVIAGVILAYIVGPTLVHGLSEMRGAEFTPELVAMLGGYAAEAVELVLQRFVDVLLTAVRGDGSAQAKAKATIAHNAKVARIEAATGEILEAGDIHAAKAAVLKLRSSLRR
jgi:hypothetical protein